MDIYGAIFSPYCARVALAARYKGVKFKLSTPPGGGYKSPEFLKLNPLGKVPTVKDGKTVIYESGVIVEYLEAKHKKKPVVPKNAKAAAQARMIASVVGEYVHGAVSKLFAQLGPDQDKAAVKAAFAEINKYLDIAEEVIAAKPYAAGAKFTIADVYAVPTLAFANLFLPMFGMDNPIGDRKKLRRYMAKGKKDKLIGPLLKDMEESFRAWQKSRAA
jgi:glutathione S-transferase